MLKFRGNTSFAHNSIVIGSLKFFTVFATLHQLITVHIIYRILFYRVI